MRRLVTSFFALALAASFNACEQNSADSLPPHYQHKLHTDGGKDHGTKHPPATHPGEAKSPGQKDAGPKPL